jgi:hypothetical protein
MNIVAHAGHFPLTAPLPDPFEDDAEATCDVRRGLLRLAIVAAGAAERFARDGIEDDPVAWMLSPRRAFEGQCALEACLKLRGFTRAIVLNAPGMDMGLDADPAALDDLSPDPRPARHAAPAADVLSPSPRSAGDRGRPGLHTASFVIDSGERQLAVFAAAICADETAFRYRVFERYGLPVALEISVARGIVSDDRLVRSLVSDAAAERLLTLDANGQAGGGHSFELLIEERR